MKTWLEDVGLALYGEQWQRQMAADLDVNDRTLRRWVSGDAEPPEGVRRQLRQMLEQSREKISAALAVLPP